MQIVHQYFICWLNLCNFVNIRAKVNVSIFTISLIFNNMLRMKNLKDHRFDCHALNESEDTFCVNDVRAQTFLSHIFVWMTSCHIDIHVWPGLSDLGPNGGQMGLKWDKSRTFSDQISVHLGCLAKIYWSLI